ncbi:MAG TPA: hypothetical protein VF774_01200, partial [Pseudoduganella sp.]
MVNVASDGSLTGMTLLPMTRAKPIIWPSVRTTPVARAFAERTKAEGRGLNALVVEKSVKLFGKNAVFAKLAASKQNRVFAEVVASAGRSQPTITRNVMRLSYVGRSVILLSLALSTYNVLTAQSKSTAIKRELVTTTAGVG